MSKAPIEIRSLARSYTEHALQVLNGIMGESTQPGSARVAAAVALLDRGWGKPTQPVDGDGEGGKIQIEQIIRKIIEPKSGD